ncbi:putative nucleotidyltransferase [Evansella vedderi]|uniref:Nucleotidyltransferase n=1 Tax=Evansella vedderi TaxID=38282 RepID=A0ABU0A0Q1_9BACI|nr:nucleotidyltransferase domain-containing protein [Evansella vedderi]MDQ0257053.1 putative nucleotidyltransferase [Evansella vedderi]
MYKHHEESLEIMIDYFKNKFPDRDHIIALVFGGSVAKGIERPDSDLDAMVIVTQEYFAKRKKMNSTSEVIDGLCTYEGGYFDIKYMTKDYIKAAAEKGSEPTRNSFIGSRVLFSKDSEIENIVNDIPVFQMWEKEDKQLSFYSALQMNYMYFWKMCEPEGYMKTHVAAEIVYMVYRLILQENHILFPSNRRLEETVQNIPNKPEGIVELCRKFCETQDNDTCDQLVDIFTKWTSYKMPEDISTVTTRYQLDYEQWWMTPRPLINEW